MAERFQSVFDGAPLATASAPGRVNLIGEHTDYNGGSVLPLAIDHRLTVEVAPKRHGALRIASQGFEGVAVRSTHEGANGHWSDYVLGAVRAAMAGDRLARDKQHGWDIAIDSSIPAGSGLSSSSALCVAVIEAVWTAQGRSIDRVALALAAKDVENSFIGVPCGIMDQMAVALLGTGECMLLDTLTLNRDVLRPPSTWRFVVVHSGVFRGLSDGRYAERRAACERAARTLGVDHLCALAELDKAAERLLGDDDRARVRHVVSEHARVLSAAKALRNGDAEKFGRLMLESHASMREDFAVTTPEVDMVVEASMQAGAIGARMTGGGFGGCVVSLIDPNASDRWAATVASLAPKSRLIC